MDISGVEYPPVNEYNKMSSAEIEFNYTGWTAAVTQTNEITVLGEQTDPLATDEVITVNVPLAKLKECLVYSSSWTASLSGDAEGSQPLPKVEFRPSAEFAAKTELDAMFALLKAKMSDVVLADRIWLDSAAGPHDCFGRILIKDVKFTDSAFDSPDLPKVAIRGIVEGDITVTELTTTAETLNTDSGATTKPFLEGLFEQLVAADRIKTTDADSTHNSAIFMPAKLPSLQVNDSISFNVTYNFTKTREYEVDGDETVGADKKALTLSIGGHFFTIQTGADGTETSVTYPRTYTFKLVAISDASPSEGDGEAEPETTPA
jgi:hypothetical protein